MIQDEGDSPGWTRLVITTTCTTITGIVLLICARRCSAADWRPGMSQNMFTCLFFISPAAALGLVMVRSGTSFPARLSSQQSAVQSTHCCLPVAEHLLTEALGPGGVGPQQREILHQVYTGAQSYSSRSAS